MSLLQTNNAQLQEILETLKNKASGGSVSHEIEDAFIDGSVIGDYSNSRVTTIQPNAFYSNHQLKSVKFDNVETIETMAFAYSLIEVANFPSTLRIAQSAFDSCNRLIEANFPQVAIVESSAFQGCLSLTTFASSSDVVQFANSFQDCTNLKSLDVHRAVFDCCFNDCPNLRFLILRSDQDMSIFYPTTFDTTGFTNSVTTADRCGGIYVPTSLLEQYGRDPDWGSYNIYPLEDNTSDGTITGEFLFTGQFYVAQSGGVLTEFEVEKHTLWSEFIDSADNEIGMFSLNSNMEILFNGMTLFLDDISVTTVTTANEIIAGHTYYAYSDGPV